MCIIYVSRCSVCMKDAHLSFDKDTAMACLYFHSTDYPIYQHTSHYCPERVCLNSNKNTLITSVDRSQGAWTLLLPRNRSSHRWSSPTAIIFAVTKLYLLNAIPVITWSWHHVLFLIWVVIYFFVFGIFPDSSDF